MSIPAYVTETGATEVATSTTETLAPANLPGNTVFIGVAARGSAGNVTVSTVADTGNNTWTQVSGAAVTSAANNLTLDLWYSNTTAACGTVTVTLSGLSSTVLCSTEVMGSLIPSPVDVKVSATGSSTAPSTGASGTTVIPNEYVFGMIASINTTAFSGQSSGWTALTQRTSAVAALNCSAQAAYKITSQLETETYAATAGNASWCALLVGFQFRPTLTMPVQQGMGPSRDTPFSTIGTAWNRGQHPVPGKKLPWARVVDSVATNSNNGAVTTLAVTAGANITVGNVMIVAAQAVNAGVRSVLSIADSAGNNWRPVVSSRYGANSQMCSVWIATVETGGGSQPTVTVTGSSALRMSMVYAEYSGIVTSGDVVDVTAQVAPPANTTNPSVTTGVTTEANQLVWSVFSSLAQAGTLPVDSSGPTSNTILTDDTQRSSSQDLIVGERDSGDALAAITSTWKSPSGSQAAIVIVFRNSDNPSPVGNPPVIQGRPFGFSPWELFRSRQQFPIQPPPTSVVYTQALAATLSFVGSIAGLAISKGVSATLSFSGNLARSINKAMTATLSFSGALSRKITKTALTATLSFSGALARSVGKGVSGTLSFSGSLSRSAAKGMSATLSFSGSLLRAIATRLAAATLSFSGAATRQLGKSLTATLSFSGSVARRAARAFTATLSFSGAVGRSNTKALTATLSFVGAATRATGKRLSGTLSFAGSIRRSIGKLVQSVLSFVTNLIHPGTVGGPPVLLFTAERPLLLLAVRPSLLVELTPAESLLLRVSSGERPLVVLSSVESKLEGIFTT